MVVHHTRQDQIRAMTLIWGVVLREKLALARSNDTYNVAVNSRSILALYLSSSLEQQWKANLASLTTLLPLSHSMWLVRQP